MSYLFPLSTCNYTMLYICVRCGGNVADYLNCCCMYMCVCVRVYIYIYILFLHNMYLRVSYDLQKKQQLPTQITPAWLVGLFNEGATCLPWGTSYILDSVYINFKPQMLSYSLLTCIHSLGIKHQQEFWPRTAVQKAKAFQCLSWTELQDTVRYGEVKVRIHSFLYSALVGDVWSPLRFVRFYCIFFLYLP